MYIVVLGIVVLGIVVLGIVYLMISLSSHCLLFIHYLEYQRALLYRILNTATEPEVL